MADEWGSGGGDSGGFLSWSPDSWQPPSFASDPTGGGYQSPSPISSSPAPDWQNFQFQPQSVPLRGAPSPNAPAWQAAPTPAPPTAPQQAPSSVNIFSRAPRFVSQSADWLSRLTTGQTPMEMARNVSQNPQGSPDVARIQSMHPDMDKRLHAYASMLTSNRFGHWPAWAIGTGKELLDLPFGQAEYGDLIANMTGLNLARPR
jgi:hypothetical protein